MKKALDRHSKCDSPQLACRISRQFGIPESSAWSTPNKFEVSISYSLVKFPPSPLLGKQGVSPVEHLGREEANKRMKEKKLQIERKPGGGVGRH